MLLASLLLLSSLAGQGQDTTFTASRGERLRLNVHEGSITVTAWNRNAVKVHAAPEDSDDDARLNIARSGGVINVSVRGRHGPPPEATFTLTVPAWMPLALSSVEGDITVRGSAAAITAETVNGDVSVTGGAGNVSLSSVDGTVDLSHASGSISVSTVNDDVSVRNSSGSVSASTVNGDVTLDAVTSSAVAMESVNGDVQFGGPIRNGGRYQLNTHNGDVIVGVQAGANATVSVNTFSGDFSTDIPVEVRTRKSQEGSFTFILGDGSARLDLESFQGTIHVTRPGQTRNK